MLAAAILLALLWSPARAQDLARRLILKDGSYQLVTKYEVKGDRVRYMSAARDDWEELPTSLVDWPATEKYEKDRAAGASVPEAVQLDKELEQERAQEEARLPQVAPGLRLPEDSGVFLLDSFQGETQLDEIQQTAGDVNRNTKGNIFRGAINPVAGVKQTIEIDGAHAAVVVDELGETAVAERHDDGSVVVELAVVNRPAFRSFVLGLLDHAEVVAPPALRDDIVDWLHAIVAAP